MTSQPTISSRAVLAMAVLILAVVPSVAAADPLLSGYGGPGAGSQVILGSTLLGGGSPPSQGASEGSGGAGTTAGTPVGGVSEAAAGHAHAGARANRSTRRSATPAGGARGASNGSAVTGVNTGSERYLALSAHVSTPPLGVSGVDLLYILLVMGGLVVTGAFTLRLSRHTRA